MSGERDAQTRLEEIIEKHVRNGNVVPFPKTSKRNPAPGFQPISISGMGASAVVGSNNQVTITIHCAGHHEL